MQNVINYFEQHNIEIISFGVNKNDDIEIHTKEHGIICAQTLPQIGDLSNNQLKSLKQQFPVQISDVQQLVVQCANEAKDNFNKKINNFINKIVNIKQSESIESGCDKKILSLLGEINDVNKNIKDEIVMLIQEKHDVFQDTHRQLVDAIKTSYIDPLTNCFNGNFYQKFLGKGYDLFNRITDIEEYNTKLDMYSDINANAVMFFDMNNFKAINDLVGHDEGDEILKKFSDTVNNFNENIVLIRAGGDEFVAIANEKILSSLETYLNSESFIEILNSHIPKDILFCDKPLQSTVSKGIAPLEFPASIHNKDEVMIFKKEFNRACNVAEAKSTVDKKRIKEENGISDYRPVTPDIYTQTVDDELKKIDDKKQSQSTTMKF